MNNINNERPDNKYNQLISSVPILPSEEQPKPNEVPNLPNEKEPVPNEIPDSPHEEEPISLV